MKYQLESNHFITSMQPMWPGLQQSEASSVSWRHHWNVVSQLQRLHLEVVLHSPYFRLQVSWGWYHSQDHRHQLKIASSWQEVVPYSSQKRGPDLLSWTFNFMRRWELGNEKKEERSVNLWCTSGIYQSVLDEQHLRRLGVSRTRIFCEFECSVTSAYVERSLRTHSVADVINDAHPPFK